MNTLGLPVEVARRTVGGVPLHVIEAGPPGGALTVLLHGFPEFWWGWRRQIKPLAQAGLRVIVPDQRGYGSSGKPEGAAAYGLDRLAADVIGLADAHGRERVRLVGHDWGGLVAWWTATRHPDRVERLVAINAPHPSVAGAYMRRHPSQMVKSSYIGLFQVPRLPEALLRAGGYRRLRRALRETSRPGTFPDADIDRYAQAWAEPGALTAMLNWYRALPRRPRDPDPLRVRPRTLVVAAGPG